MSKLPKAILFDLDDTILAAFGQAQGQWQRVIAAFIEHLAPHPPDDVVAAIQAYSRHLWSDAARHKDWRPRIGEARRHIVSRAFAGLAGAAGRPVPPSSVCNAIADRFNELHEAELRMFPGAHETLDRLKELGVRLALVTNGAAKPQRAKVIRFALEERFDHIQIEGEHGFGKPEERAYTHAMAAVLLAQMLDLAGIIDAAAALGRFGRLQVRGELADVLLELGERPEGLDVEHRHKAAVIVPPGRLHPEAEPGQETAQDLDHHREAVALVALAAADREEGTALP